MVSSSRPDYIWKPTRLCLIKLCFKKVLPPSLFTLCPIAWPRLVSVAICIILHFLERQVLVFSSPLYLLIWTSTAKNSESTCSFWNMKIEGRKKGKIKSSLFLCLWAKGAVLCSFDTENRNHFNFLLLSIFLFYFSLFIYCSFGFYLCSENAPKA